jgi:hypothetical protein
VGRAASVLPYPSLTVVSQGSRLWNLLFRQLDFRTDHPRFFAPFLQSQVKGIREGFICCMAYAVSACVRACIPQVATSDGDGCECGLAACTALSIM